MSILYAMVARGSVVLAEYSSSSSNANAVARQILEKLPSSADTRVSYSQDRFIFHVTKAEGITFLCMANDTFGSKPSFPILLNLKRIHCKTRFKINAVYSCFSLIPIILATKSDGLLLLCSTKIYVLFFGNLMYS